MTLFDGQPLTEDECRARCTCGHIDAAHGLDGDECSDCLCPYLERENDD